MEKRSLKLKLKIGGPPTPELEYSPTSHSANIDSQDMAEEEPAPGSEEEVEEEEWPEDGQNENGEDDGLASRTRHSHHDENTREKHKKSKKKKKKREREKEKERHKHRHHRDKIDGEEEGEPPAKKQHIKVEGEEPAPAPVGSQTSLTEVLQYLIDQLMKKDPQQFFAHPVTDAIAPGYSSIITQPMDFSRMKEKITNSEYSNIPQFVNDMKLMCNNCMTYNQQDTIYYKSAKKLLHLGEKMLSKEKLLTMRKELPVIATLTKEQLGFEFPLENTNGVAENGDGNVTDDSQTAVVKEEDGIQSDVVSKFEAIPDDLTPEEVTEQVTTAAQEAAEKLTQKKAECTLGFLRQREDGTTSLNFLIGCESSDPNIKEKPVSLGFKTGKLTQGSAALHNYREDKRSIAKPVKPLNYGAYSSFCPSYDSTFANLTKEESEMVYATYGNDTAVQYAESIMDFSRNCDTATYLVDQLLDLLTHQQHSRTQATIEERRKLQEEENKVNSLITPKQEANSDSESKSDNNKDDFDFDSLRGLSQLGIDTSFLNYFEELEQKSKNIKMQLDENAQLLQDLSKTQKERLSKPLPPNLNNLPQPSNSELQLVEKVTEGLTNIARQVPPGSLAPVPIVRRALGITMVPVPPEAEVSEA